MIGYKAFDKNLCCRGFQYEVGKTYTKTTKKEELRMCSDNAFHFCRELYAIEMCSNYKLSESRICEVIAGDYIHDGDKVKYCTNNITILREIVGDEKLELINSGNCNSGYCNSDNQPIRIFNQETDVEEIDFPNFFYFDLTIFVSYDTATDDERQQHKKDIEVCGGFLKAIPYKEAWRRSWDKATDEDRRKVLKLPNWNNEIFKEISGIDVEFELGINK
jgi:hypothetical protein